MSGDLDAAGVKAAQLAWGEGTGPTSHDDMCAAIRAYLAHAQPERRGAEAMRERAAQEVDCVCLNREIALNATSQLQRWNACKTHRCGALTARAIRALPLPGDEEPTP